MIQEPAPACRDTRQRSSTVLRQVLPGGPYQLLRQRLGVLRLHEGAAGRVRDAAHRLGALADADHTLAFMDFVRDHASDQEYIQAHEQYRGFVLFQRTQAAAALHLQRDDPEGAINEIHAGLGRMRQFFTYFEAEEQMEDNPMIQHLHKMETSVRQQHHIEETLQEQLNRAVENEEYEKAARLRDALRKRQ